MRLLSHHIYPHLHDPVQTACGIVEPYTGTLQTYSAGGVCFCQHKHGSRFTNCRASVANDLGASDAFAKENRRKLVVQPWYPVSCSTRYPKSTSYTFLNQTAET